MESKYLTIVNGKFLIMSKKEFAEYVDLYGGYSSAARIKSKDLAELLGYTMDLKTAKSKLDGYIKENRLKRQDINKIWE